MGRQSARPGAGSQAAGHRRRRRQRQETLIDELVRRFDAFPDRKIAVLANDPPPPAAERPPHLADRVRMNNIYEQVWLRSVATGSVYRPLSPACPYGRASRGGRL
jgi:hypothetical protein